MNRLSYVKTDSYVSLVDLEDEEAPVIKPPVFVFGVDSHGAYLRHRAEDLANRGEIFVERRVHSGDSEVTTLLRLESGRQTSSQYLIILDTNHQAFTNPRSSVVRSLDSFYFLSSTLKKLYPRHTVPALPNKLRMWVLTSQQRLSVLSAFLARVLSEEVLLSDKIVHTFLATGTSLQDLQERLEDRPQDKTSRYDGKNLWRRITKRKMSR